MNQSSCFQNNLVDLSNAPWTMHEFFAGSGLVAYGLKGMFKPIWANDISEQKAAVYKENFGDGYFKLDDIKNINGKNLPDWIWWYTEKPARRKMTLKDVVEEQTQFDKDEALRLVPPRHQQKLDMLDTVYATGYRRTRNGKQQLELRFDGIAGCLRTPEGGSSKQYLVVKKDGTAHARLLTVRETARLMGAPDSFKLPGSQNDGYKAMGDAVAKPVAEFLGKRFLAKIAEAVYQ